MADQKETIKRKSLFNPKIWSEIVKLAAERLEEKKQRRRQTRVKGRKTTERKFWHQPSFWVWVVTAILIAAVAPSVITPAITKAISWVSPLQISWVTMGALSFFGFLGLSAWSKSKKYLKQIFWAWFVIATLLIVKRPTIIIPEISGAIGVSWLVVEVLVLGVLGLWLKDNFDQIGTIESPAQGVLVRFGRAVDAVDSGLYFRFRPFENYKKFPTGQYSFEYSIEKGLYTKEEGRFRSQPIEVVFVLYVRFPKVKNRYSFPVISRRKAQTKKEEIGGLATEEIFGKELLMRHTFYRLPVRNLYNEGAFEKMQAHFEGAAISAARHVLSGVTSKKAKEEIQWIEDEIKTYLLYEEGNPFFESGIPVECMDIELKKVKLPDDTEQAYKKPELKRKDAEAAEYEAKTIRKKMAAFRAEGVSSDVAGVLVGGITGEGKPMGLGDLRDLSIALSILDKGKGSIPNPQK